MIAHLLVGSELDGNILKKILPNDLVQDVTFMVGGGIAGIQSMARSLVVTRPWPLAIVIDSDSSEAVVGKAQQQSMTEVVRSVSDRVPVGVFVAAPELAIVFFYASSTLLRVFPVLASKPYIVEVAHENVKAAFKLLDPSKTGDEICNLILNELNEGDVSEMRRLPFVSDLIKFLASCRLHRVSLRVEIGPGIPANLQALKEPDGFKALLTAMVAQATSTGDNSVMLATSGNTTVEFDFRNFQVGSVEPAGTLPSTFYMEIKGFARVAEKEEQSKDF